MTAECGTDHGWHAHRSRGETPCKRCNNAHELALAAWRIARATRNEADDEPTPVVRLSAQAMRFYRTTPVKRPRCGTPAGFQAHRKAGTKPCTNCSLAWHTLAQRTIARNAEQAVSA